MGFMGLLGLLVGFRWFLGFLVVFFFFWGGGVYGVHRVFF